jgi:hypothetical protein
MRFSIAATTFALVVATAPACGGKAAPEKTYDSHAAAAGESHAMEGEHHGVGVAEIDSFHATLAPIWHAPAGPERTRHACAAVPTMRDQATQIVGRARGDHAGWEGNASNLATAVGALSDACGKGGGVDDALGGVHTAYHAVMEAAMGGDHEHMEHMEHMEH